MLLLTDAFSIPKLAQFHSHLDIYKPQANAISYEKYGGSSLPKYVKIYLYTFCLE